MPLSAVQGQKPAPHTTPRGARSEHRGRGPLNAATDDQSANGVIELLGRR